MPLRPLPDIPDALVARAGRRPFLRERRTIPRCPGPYTPAEIRAAGLRAVSAELSLRPLADDVARELRGRTTFPRSLIAAEAFGA